MEMLKALCDISGVSGDESRVRRFILNEIKDLGLKIDVDSIGNIIAYKKGKNSTAKVMVSAHMDEVGFIVSGITEKGYLNFQTVGGIYPRVLISRRVKVGKDGIDGIIGIKAIHLQTAEEGKTVPSIESLYIDIGAKSKDEALKTVKLGEYVSFEPNFTKVGNNIVSKAFDDRVGCYALIQLLKEEYDNDLYACFTAQEETGLRGSKIASNVVLPDFAVALEATTCADAYGSEPNEYATILGGGAVISIRDGSSIADKRLATKLYSDAKNSNLDIQYKMTTAGGNDAGSMHLAGNGARTISISIPARYIHSPISMACEKDINSMIEVAKLYLKGLKNND